MMFGAKQGLVKRGRPTDLRDISGTDVTSSQRVRELDLVREMWNYFVPKSRRLATPYSGAYRLLFHTFELLDPPLPCQLLFCKNSPANCVYSSFTVRVSGRARISHGIN